jgi:Domain of unknown function (DUF202)
METDASDNRAAQVERTVLAWNRSSLAVAANGGLLSHQGFTRGSAGLTAAGFAVMAVGAGLWLLSTGRYPEALGASATHVLGGHRAVVPVAAAFVVFLSVVDLVLAASG